MASSTLMQPQQKQNVGMGQVGLSNGDMLLSAVLGSCVGLALYHPRLKIGALAHIVLPAASSEGALPGKFADTALPHLLAELAGAGVPRAGIVAKIAGGACMFGASGPLQIGENNIAAVTRLLAEENITLLAEDVGGNKGRRVTFDCKTGELCVEIAGQPKKIL